MASPSATCALVWCACCVHRIFHPTFSDDRETPLMRAEDARKRAGDLPVVTRKKARGILARRANQLTCQKECQGFIVVLAKARTHTPRLLLRQSAGRLSFKHNDRWLWVPAFAGT